MKTNLLRKHVHYGSTPNLYNLVTTVKSNTDRNGRLLYASYDPTLGVPPTEEQKVLLSEYTPILPVITFTGSEKLHGENMAVCYFKGEYWVQGRNHIRIPVTGDQNGMAQFVEDTLESWTTLINYYVDTYSIDTDTHILCIDCEWAGANIHKGSAACSGITKSAFIFDHIRVVNYEDLESSITLDSSYSGEHLHPNIHFMKSFGTYSVTIDFNDLIKASNDLDTLVSSIEDSSPIARFFNKPDNVGEGLYLISEPTGEHPAYRLKAKGTKHGGKPKVLKTQSALSEDELQEHLDLAEKVTPTWRLSQAIQETQAISIKDTGKVIAWVIQDIIKEESLALEEADISLNAIKRLVSSITKDYFHSQLLT